MYENIPKELKKLKQWCGYRLVPADQKPKKVPINAYTGGNAQSNNPQTWSEFDVAVAAIEKFGCTGIGFFFGNGEPYFGVDIDGIDEDIKKYKDGDNDNIMSEFIHSLGSYAEYSQSGKGIHIICKGTLPEGARRKGNVEMYSSGRYFICTSNIASEYTEIVDCTENIKFLHAKYLGSQMQEQEMKSLDISEREIIDIALKSKNGQAFSTLQGGQWETLYPSQSEADLAFCNMLAFWCGRDKDKMDSIMRSSGLYREKWDGKRGGSTYGNYVLDKAINDCREVFVPGSGIEDYSISIVSKNERRYAFDDTGNADRFVEKFKNKARYSYANKGWFFYNGKKWERDGVGYVKNLAESILKDMKDQRGNYCTNEEMEKLYDKHMKYTRNNKGKENMLKESQHRMAILPGEFDRDKEVFNTANGVLNLKKVNLTEHRAEQYLSKISHVEYTNKIDCPMWEEFLDQIFMGDKGLIKYVQKAIGYSMTGSTREQCAFFCFGNGRNGKSTFLDIIAAIMGDYAVNIQPETIMIKNSMSSTTGDIARLKGARFVTTVEPNEGVRLNEGLLKQLTGGDKVTACKKYENEIEFEPEFKLWMSTNHKPIIRGLDEGIWRRMHLIPFTAYISDDKVDKNLKYKLKKELTAILNWAVEGCLLWQREGLGLPQAVIDAGKEYRNEMDVISAFMEECTVTGPGETKASELYKSYVDWAEENNEYKMSNTKFGKEMTNRFNKIRKMDGYFFQGLKLVKEYRPYSINY